MSEYRAGGWLEITAGRSIWRPWGPWFPLWRAWGRPGATGDQRGRPGRAAGPRKGVCSRGGLEAAGGCAAGVQRGPVSGVEMEGMEKGAARLVSVAAIWRAWTASRKGAGPGALRAALAGVKVQGPGVEITGPAGSIWRAWKGACSLEIRGAALDVLRGPGKGSAAGAAWRPLAAMLRGSILSHRRRRAGGPGRGLSVGPFHPVHRGGRQSTARALFLRGSGPGCRGRFLSRPCGR